MVFIPVHPTSRIECIIYGGKRFCESAPLTLEGVGAFCIVAILFIAWFLLVIKASDYGDYLCAVVVAAPFIAGSLLFFI